MLSTPEIEIRSPGRRYFGVENVMLVVAGEIVAPIRVVVNVFEADVM